ncbi:MAG: nicotinate-nucleotide--dimethylbenzimidazole phosphoribosyltransferase [Bryobacteraceae bacterium]
MSLIEETVANISSLDRSTAITQAVQARWDSLTKPRGSLGRLEAEILRLAQIQGTPFPNLDRAAIYVFCGDHGITKENVSPYPQAVTREMMKNFVAGGAAINVLCRNSGIDTVIVDAGVCGPKIDGVMDRKIADGTRSFLEGPAMEEAQARSAIETGVILAAETAESFNIVGTGEMGIGNSASASALVSAFLGISPDDCVGRGAGLDDAGLSHKKHVISTALSRYGDELKSMSPIHLIALFGGFEIAMMAGFILGAAAKRLPAIIDGFISTAAFVAAQKICPSVADYVFFGHQSSEPGHTPVLKSIGRAPLLNLELRLGEGTGAALGVALLRSGLRLYREMATFAQASVSDKRIGPEEGK